MSGGVKVFVVRRPELPANFIVVEGKARFAQEIERLLPEFFRCIPALLQGHVLLPRPKLPSLHCLQEIS